jgi:hypothetical protein
VFTPGCEASHLAPLRPGRTRGVVCKSAGIRAFLLSDVAPFDNRVTRAPQRTLRAASMRRSSSALAAVMRLVAASNAHGGDLASSFHADSQRELVTPQKNRLSRCTPASNC